MAAEAWTLCWQTWAVSLLHTAILPCVNVGPELNQIYRNIHARRGMCLAAVAPAGVTTVVDLISYQESTK
jgi:hypothetical protein